MLNDISSFLERYGEIPDDDEFTSKFIEVLSYQNQNGIIHAEQDETFISSYLSKDSDHLEHSRSTRKIGSRIKEKNNDIGKDFVDRASSNQVIKDRDRLVCSDLIESFVSECLDDDSASHSDLGEAFVSAYVYDDDELMHYGVKGMKWGVRRTAAQLGHYLSSKGKKVMDRLRARRDKKKQVKEETKATKKDVKDMTNDELRAAIARKKLENEYEQMFPKKASLISSVVAPAMINSAKNFVQKSLDTAVNNILEKNNNKKETDSIESYVEKLSSMSPDDIKKYQTAAKVAGLINTIKSSKGNKGNKGNNG